MKNTLQNKEATSNCRDLNPTDSTGAYKMPSKTESVMLMQSQEHPQCCHGDSPSKAGGRSVPSPWPLLSAVPSVCVLPSLLPSLPPCTRALGAAAPSAVALPAGEVTVMDCWFLQPVPIAHRRNPPSPSSLFPKPQGELPQSCRHVPQFTCAAPGAALGQSVTLAGPWPALGGGGGEDGGDGLGGSQGALEGFAGVPP